MVLISRRPKPEGAAAGLPAQRNLHINTLSLIASNMLTGVLGLVFWGAAARLYPTDAVGIGAAVITSAIMLSTLSMLSIDTLYERFLMLAGTRAPSLLIRGFVVVATVALLAGIGLVIFGPRASLFETDWEMACYPLMVVILAIYTMLDKTTAGLGVARWAAAKNTVHSIVKLVVLFALAWTASSISIIMSWVATAGVAVVVVLLGMRSRVRNDPHFAVPPTLPPDREMVRYFGSSFGLTATWAIGPLVVPLIVLGQFGADANAHFAVTWAIINAFYTTVHLILSPYVAEVAAHPDKVAALTRRMLQTMIAATVVGSAGLVIAGPFVLGLVGGDYRVEGQGLLFLAAVFVPLSAVAGVYEGFARVRRKLGFVMIVRASSTVVLIVATVMATREFGVIGVGWAYLLSEALLAVVFIVPTVLWIRWVNRNPDLLEGQAATNEVRA